MSEQRLIFFRVDSSTLIGGGHVYRCLNLANALREYGANCHFICRNFDGNLTKLIEQQNHQCHLLNTPNNQSTDYAFSSPAHASWLGVTQYEDAHHTKQILESFRPDHLIVDHYGIAKSWEMIVRTSVSSIAVIDDLADREHDCDTLVDPNIGRKPKDYATLIPQHCSTFIGLEYFMPHPRFLQVRHNNLDCRREHSLKDKPLSLLVNFGSMDQSNMTGKVLTALQKSPSTLIADITIIMGGNAPHKSEVKDLCQNLSHPSQFLSGVDNVADILTQCDAAIGAVGLSAIERLSLGVPTICIPIAENQKRFAHHLDDIGAAIMLKLPLASLDEFGHDLVSAISKLNPVPEHLALAVASKTDQLVKHILKAKQA